MGKCFEEPKAPSEENNTEDYVLCCINGKRGQGNHCLKYDYSKRYDIYRPISISDNQVIESSITNNNVTVTFNVTSPSYTTIIPNFCELQIQIDSITQLPPPDLCYLGYTFHNNSSNMSVYR